MCIVVPSWRRRCWSIITNISIESLYWRLWSSWWRRQPLHCTGCYFHSKLPPSAALLTWRPTQVRQGASATAPWPVELTRWHKIWPDDTRFDPVTQDGRGPTTVTPRDLGGQARVTARGSPLTFTQFVEVLSNFPIRMMQLWMDTHLVPSFEVLLLRGSILVAYIPNKMISIKILEAVGHLGGLPWRHLCNLCVAMVIFSCHHFKTSPILLYLLDSIRSFTSNQLYSRKGLCQANWRKQMARPLSQASSPSQPS